MEILSVTGGAALLQVFRCLYSVCILGKNEAGQPEHERICFVIPATDPATCVFTAFRGRAHAKFHASRDLQSIGDSRE